MSCQSRTRGIVYLYVKSVKDMRYCIFVCHVSQGHKVLYVCMTCRSKTQGNVCLYDMSVKDTRYCIFA